MSRKEVVTFAIITLSTLITAYWGSAAENDLALPKQPPVQVLTDENTILNGVPIKAVIFDPTPPKTLRKIPAQVNLATAAQTATSSFEITYVANGDSDKWGEVTCSTFPEEAKAAFNAAADIWANILISDIPITIQPAGPTWDLPQFSAMLADSLSNTIFQKRSAIRLSM